MNIKKKQKLAKEWFIKLQNLICKNVEILEKDVLKVDLKSFEINLAAVFELRFV